MKLDGDKVIDQYGAVLAEKIHGEWHSKDPAVLEFVMNQDGCLNHNRVAYLSLL